MTKIAFTLFNSWAEIYDNRVSPAHISFPCHGYEEVLDEAIRLSHIELGKEVLDLGIGAGNLPASLVREGCIICAVDFSADMLMKACAKLPESILVKGEILSDCPIELHSPFDRVVSAYVFHKFDVETKIGFASQDLLSRPTGSSQGN